MDNKSLKFTENEIKQIYVLYQQGKNCAELGKLYNVHPSTISKNFIKYNLKLRNNNDFKTISDVKILDIYKEYEIGLSSVQLGEKYHVSASYIIKRFRDLKLHIRNNKINSRKYFCNENYFTTIDDEHKAYWLGFIYADGYVSNTKTNGKSFGISISVKDILLLEKLKYDLNTDYPINNYICKSGYKINTPYCRLLIRSDKLVDDLITNGCVLHKTSILKPPNLKHNLIKHFIRGYMDGDGSIWLNNAKYPFYSVSFMGTEDMLDYIIQYLKNEQIITYTPKFYKREKHQTVSSIKFGGNQLVNKILTNIYNDSTIYLERKHLLFLQLQNLLNSRL